jgi:hypothetical protein
MHSLVAGLDEVLYIPLEHFSYQRGQKLNLALNQLLKSSGVRARDARGPRLVPTTTDADFSSILTELLSYVVNPVLDGLAITVKIPVISIVL